MSSLFVAAASAARGWPFASLTAAPWFYQLNATNDFARYALLALFYVGVAGLCWCWFRLWRYSQDNDVPLKRLALLGVIWSSPLLFAAPLFSGDVYVYYVDGEALARGFDPYQSGVSAMGATPMVHMVHELWRTTTTMYGPVFMVLAQFVATISGGSVIVAMLIFRVIAVVSVVGVGFGVVALARHFNRPAGPALVLAVLNPLTLLHLVNSAHNDATMIGLLVGGLALGVTSKSWPLRIVAIALCVMGAMFKIPAFAGVLVLGWLWCKRDTAIFKRMVAAGAAGVVGLVIFELLTLATGKGWGWIHSADVPGLAHPLLAPANAFAMAFGGLVGKGNELNTYTRLLANAASVLLAAWLVLRTGRNGSAQSVIRATGFALLAIAWLGPAVYPWYLTWGVIILAASGAGRLQRPVVLSVIAACFLVLPGGYGTLDLWSDWRRTVVAFVVVAVWLAILYTLKMRKVVWFRRPAGTAQTWDSSVTSSSA